MINFDSSHINKIWINEFSTIMYVYYKQSEMDIHMSEQIEDVKYVISRVFQDLAQ